MELNQTQKTLLGVLSKALTGAEYEIPADTDWAALYAESKAQAVAPLVFSCVSQYCTDEEIFQKWKSVTLRSLQKNGFIQQRHGALHRLLEENDIPYCVIKGCASARDYPDPLLRAMGDVDFLVSDKNWKRATEVLVKDGFVTAGDTHPFHLSFHKKAFYMEMHHEPFGLPGDAAAKLLDIVPEMIDGSVLAECDGISFRMPDRFGHGIVLLLHAYRHLIDTGVGVRHLCDWAMFVAGFSGDEFVQVFKERFQALGIWKLAQVFGATAHRYLSIPHQDWMDEVDEQTCQMLVLDIFDGGNFGRGDGERTTQNLSIYGEKKQLAKSGKKTQLLRGLNQTAMQRYPRLMKIKIFRPFGWIILGVRYVFRVLTGKRKKVPTGTMQMVDMRRKLYQQLEVFESK